MHIVRTERLTPGAHRLSHETMRPKSWGASVMGRIDYKLPTPGCPPSRSYQKFNNFFFTNVLKAPSVIFRYIVFLLSTGALPGQA